MRLSSLDNFKEVIVWGQSTSSFPSFEPHIRVTTLARSTNTGWDMGPTYMVGGKGGEGSSAILGPYPAATPLNFFCNGIHLGESHQGAFNDHRTRT